MQRLKLYNRVPANGLTLFTGKIVQEDGKERHVTIDYEPSKPVSRSLYLCDSRFHVESLAESLASSEKFGFIVIDGNGALFATLSGNARNILHKFNVDLPKKHGRGGQSKLRFERLRAEKRHNYVRKVAELAVQFFLSADKVNVAALILAGSADFKNDLATSDMFDARLKAKVIKVVDVAYGGENGFHQAIQLSSEVLGNVRLVQERKLLEKFFEQIAQDTGKFVFGIVDTMSSLDMGACETLILWEDLDIVRFVVKSKNSADQKILLLNAEQRKDTSNFREKDPATGIEVDLDIVEQQPLTEWLVENHKKFGAKIELVSHRSPEGSQFCRGFGGIGGLLRWKVDTVDMEPDPDDDGEDIGLGV